MTDTIEPDALSWLRLPPVEPTPEVREIFARTEAKIGFVRTNQRVAAHRPGLAIGQDALSRGVQQAPEIGLSPREREIIALVVSAENRCEACVIAHAAVLREITGDDFFVAKLAINPAHVELPPRERALVDYAVAISRAPWDIVPADLDRLRAAGLDDGEILDAAAVAAYFNFSNRLNSAVGVAPNREAHVSHRHSAAAERT